jgi:hypothetical protein
MDRKTILGRVEIAGLACASAVLLSLDCKSVGEVGSGGAGGSDPSTNVGVASDGGATGSAGGSMGPSDAAVTLLKLDAPPLWWGTADAPQAPEVSVAPSVDSNCGMVTRQTTRQPVDVLLVLDRSASMDYSISADCYCTSAAGQYAALCTDTTSCTTRWNAIKPAVADTLSGSAYVNWGLKFFPSPGGTAPVGPSRAGVGVGSCLETSTIEVPITANSAANVESDVSSATFDLSTPTAAALAAATSYLSTLSDGNKKYILLATDGQPNCGGTPPSINTDDLTGATSAAAAAYAAGFQVYVVGIGPSLANLTQMAKAGGTTDFYPVSSPKDLGAALSSISTLVGSCSFRSDQPPPDQSNVAVYVNGQKVGQDPNNGWTFGASPQEIVLTGDYCKQMSTGNQVDVQILFGCPDQPDFPPNIY